MALAQPFSKAPPIILFGGQGSPNLFSATSSKKAQENAERSLYSAQLLSRWHAVFLEECQGLDQASQQCLKLNTTGFLRQRDLLEIPRRLHNNPLIQSITICLYQLLHYAAELDCGYLSKIKYSVPPILEATGICSGLLTAAVAAASKDVSSVVRNGVEALRLAFSVGAQAMFHTQNYEDKSDSSSSWCLIATGLKRAEILDALESFNQKVRKVSCPNFATGAYSIDWWGSSKGLGSFDAHNDLCHRPARRSYTIPATDSTNGSHQVCTYSWVVPWRRTFGGDPTGSSQ